MSIRETLTYSTEAEWLEARKRDLTSTECAALFGCSPYLTEYELYHLKTGALQDSFKANDRTIWGNRLEASIAAGIAEDYGLIVEPFKTYARLADLRMGASFDFRVVGIVPGFDGDQTYRDMYREHGDGIMEIKNVDGLQFKRGWLYGEETEAPPHIELQIQHQLEVSGLKWSIGAALVGGNRPVVFLRMADAEVAGFIRAKVAAFWARVASGIAPEPDYTTDASTIAKLYINSDGEVVDMSANERLQALCMTYKEHGAIETEAKKAKDAAKAEILTMIGTAGKVLANGFTISASTTQPSFIEAYTRAGYRNVRITAKK